MTKLISLTTTGIFLLSFTPFLQASAAVEDCPSAKGQCQAALGSGDFASGESTCRCGLNESAGSGKFCLEDVSGVFDTKTACDTELEKLPGTVGGQNFRLPGGGVPKTGGGILEDIQRIANWVFAIFLAISLIYLILGAFQFVTGGGDPAQVNQARQKLIYALVGIAIGLLIFGIPAIIRNIVV